MTTAHKQLYRKNFNPKYGTTCDHAANNRRIAKDVNLVRQSKKNNPLWIERNKRYDKLYTLIRKAALIYYSMPDISNAEKIAAVKNQLGVSESKAREYIQYAEQFRFSVSLDLSDDNSGNEPIENKMTERSPAAEEEFFRFFRRQIIFEAAAKLSYKELRILTETIDVYPFCFGHIPKSDHKTYEELALILGYSGGDVVERQRKRIFEKMREIFRAEGF